MLHEDLIEIHCQSMIYFDVRNKLTEIVYYNDRYESSLPEVIILSHVNWTDWGWWYFVTAHVHTVNEVFFPILKQISICQVN